VDAIGTPGSEVFMKDVPPDAVWSGIAKFDAKELWGRFGIKVKDFPSRLLAE